MLQAADSLSFLETNIDLFLNFARSGRRTLDEVRDKFIDTYERIQVEHARELASLRVLGFTRGEVSRVLFTELVLLTVLAIPPGWMMGYGFGWLLIKAFSSDLYRVPFVIETATYAKATLVVLAATITSALIVRKRIDRLDLIAVLKTRD